MKLVLQQKSGETSTEAYLVWQIYDSMTTLFLQETMERLLRKEELKDRSRLCRSTGKIL